MSGQEVDSSGLWTLDSAGNASRVTDAVREKICLNIYCPSKSIGARKKFDLSMEEDAIDFITSGYKQTVAC